MATDFTIIVATRNRAAYLGALLQDLGAQETAGFTYDVMVVDNGSTDETRAVVQRQQRSFPVPLLNLYEGRPGKPWALNAGMQQARGRFFAFTDDDMQVTPGWLKGLWACFRATGADAIIGRILPRWMNDRPAWLTDDVFWASGAMGCVDYGPKRLNSHEKKNVLWAGGNMAIRREVYERMGGYDLRMTRGQDTEYYRRAVEHRFKTVYEPDAVTFHKIPPERTTKQYFQQWSHRTGYYEAQMVPWKLTHVITVMPLSYYANAGWLIKKYFQSKISKAPWGRQFCYELWVRQTGSMWLRRLQLWPRGCLTVLTERRYVPNCAPPASAEAKG